MTGGWDVSRETHENLQVFLRLLGAWNARINLVAPGPESDWWDRHVVDSLQLIPLLPPGDEPMADLGAGGGFPGLILAIATGRPIHLVEADQRKCAFLREVAARLCLKHVQVHAKRIADVELPPLSAVTARALSPLAELLGYAHRLLAKSGVAIFPKGRKADEELTSARQSWHMKIERFSSVTATDSVIFRFRDISPV